MRAELPPGARIPLLSGDNLTPEQQRVYDAVVSGPRGAMVGPLRAALHSPELADRWQKLGEQLRYNTSIPHRLSELAIIVVARFWNSNVEWLIHAAIARRAGLPAAVIEAIRLGESPWIEDELEAQIYEFTRQLLAFGQVGDAAYDALQQRFEPVWLVELTALVGYYSMVAMTLNAHHVTPPPGEEAPLPAGPSGALQPTTHLPPARTCPP